jgi:two-component system sensor histidine kinase QseC
VKSIRRWLLKRLLLTVVGLWLALAVLVYWSTQHEVEEVLDSELAQYARVLQTLAAARQSDTSAALAIGAYSGQRSDVGHHYERKLRLQVWSVDGKLLLHSTDAPADDPVPTVAGYAIQPGAPHQWRTFTLLGGPHDAVVRVAERADVRSEMVVEIALSQLAPGLLVLPISALLVWIVVGKGLQPLHRIAAEVSRRSPDQLEPLRQLAVPTEIKPLVDALNRLFERLQTTFERERRFLADAAHELRTPLAAIKAHAQAAIGASDPAQRRRALDNIVRGVDRAAHLEAQLLSLARLDPEAREALQPVLVNLTRLAREVLSELAPAAIAKEVELDLEGEEDLRTLGDMDLLGILLRNLVDNAIHHTPPAGAVHVTLSQETGRALLSVSDTGPGIPAAERERVFERFYRGQNRHGSGSGLGLSIVRRIAELHGARVRLRSAPSGGLVVDVELRLDT